MIDRDIPTEFQFVFKRAARDTAGWKFLYKGNQYGHAFDTSGLPGYEQYNPNFSAVCEKLLEDLSIFYEKLRSEA